VDGQSVVLLLCGIIDKLVDGGTYLVFGALAFVWRDIFGVPIDEAIHSAAFPFVGFSFALVAFSFAFSLGFPLPFPDCRTLYALPPRDLTSVGRLPYWLIR
jgi:hypothetical protein